MFIHGSKVMVLSKRFLCVANGSDLNLDGQYLWYKGNWYDHPSDVIVHLKIHCSLKMYLVRRNAVLLTRLPLSNTCDDRNGVSLFTYITITKHHLLYTYCIFYSFCLIGIRTMDTCVNAVALCDW